MPYREIAHTKKNIKHLKKSLKRRTIRGPASQTLSAEQAHLRDEQERRRKQEKS